MDKQQFKVSTGPRYVNLGHRFSRLYIREAMISRIWFIAPKKGVFDSSDAISKRDKVALNLKLPGIFSVLFCIYFLFQLFYAMNPNKFRACEVSALFI